MNREIDITSIRLTTSRLVLREFTKDDLKDLYEYASVPGVGEMAGWNHHQNIEESSSILDSFIEGKHTFAIEYNDKVIGSLGLENYNEGLFPELDPLMGKELGFVIGKDYWGQGIVKEACEAVIKWLFLWLQLDFVSCVYFLENKQSQRVQEKIGFKPYKQIKTSDYSGVSRDAMFNIFYKKDLFNK